MKELNKCLQDISYENYNWRLVLYRINKKGAYSVKASFCHLDEKDFKTLVSKLIKDTNAFFLKDFSDTCTYHSGMDAKAKLIKIDITDTCIFECMKIFLKAIIEADNDTFSTQGYVLHGASSNNEIYFISKTNPVINSKRKSLFFKANNNEFKIEEKELYSFATVPHIIILNNNLYTSNLLIFEDLFNLTSKIEKSALENKEIISNASHLPDKFKDYIKNIGKAKYRNITYLSKARLEQLKTIDAEIAEKYNIIINNGEILVETDAQLQALEHFLFEKTIFDLADNQLHKVEYFEEDKQPS